MMTEKEGFQKRGSSDLRERVEGWEESVDWWTRRVELTVSSTHPTFAKTRREGLEHAQAALADAMKRLEEES